MRHREMVRWRVGQVIAMIVGAVMLALIVLGIWKAWELTAPKRGDSPARQGPSRFAPR